MKKNNLIKAALLMFFACISSVTYSQDFKSIINGITNVVTSKSATAENIIGTWTYSKPAVDFDSDNLLAKAGGEIASSKVESKLSGIFEKVGMTAGKGTFVFDNDGNYIATIGKAVSRGTYTFDSSEQTITMVSQLGIQSTAKVVMSSNTLKLLFKANKVLSFVKTVGSTMSRVSSNSSLAIINSLVGQYSGMEVGLELTK